MNEVFHINDIFWTLQGEGYNAGRRSLFIRMPFCNLKCSWCDTSFNTYTLMSTDDIKNIMREEPARLAVLTGGEPTMNKQLPSLIKLLKENNFLVACESNGTFDPPDGIDWLTVSPKRDANYKVTEKAMQTAFEFKFVVDKDFDFSVLTPFSALQNGALLYLSPEFTNMKENVDKIIAFIKTNPRWHLSLQTHKWTGIK